MLTSCYHKWKLSHQNKFGVCCRYIIYNSEVNKPINESQHKDVSFPSTDVMLEGLQADKLYELRLSSVNDKGYSDPSPPTIIFVGVAGRMSSTFCFELYIVAEVFI